MHIHTFQNAGDVGQWIPLLLSTNRVRNWDEDKKVQELPS